MKSNKTNAQHREQARTSLKNNWGIMAMITLLAFLFRVIVGSVVGGVINFPADSSANNGLSFLLNNLLFFAITYATYFCALRVLRGEKVEPGLLLSVFHKPFYLPLLVINLLQYIIELVVSFIILLPVFITSGAALYFGLMFNTATVETIQMNLASSVSLALLVIIFSLLMVFASVFISGVFQFAVWVKMDDPQLGIKEILTTSFSLMKGRFGQYILLQLSFIGWFIIGALVAGIGLLWVIPYHNVAIASFYDTARKEKIEPLIVA